MELTPFRYQTCKENHPQVHSNPNLSPTFLPSISLDRNPTIFLKSCSCCCCCCCCCCCVCVWVCVCVCVWVCVCVCVCVHYCYYMILYYFKGMSCFVLHEVSIMKSLELAIYWFVPYKYNSIWLINCLIEEHFNLPQGTHSFTIRWRRGGLYWRVHTHWTAKSIIWTA